MNVDGSILLLLVACCIVLFALQAAEWGRAHQCGVALALAVALHASGELASRTSAAEILRWVSSPQRRQDLAALLLAEALLFGSHAVRLAQAQEAALSGWWRRLGWLPPPSALLSLFFAQVAVMLLVDGWDYDTLAWLCGAGFALLLCLAVALLGWALPERPLRCTLRVGLHAAQAVAALWLARPAMQALVDQVPLWGGRLVWVAVIVAALAAVGLLLQRLR